jgi:hypothetical protein
MPSKRDLAARIVAEFIELVAAPDRARTHPPGQFPHMIPFGEKGSLVITPEMDDLIVHLATELRRQRPELARAVREQEWREWVRSSVGLALLVASPDAATDVAAKDLLRILEGALEQQLGETGAREYAFGASVFANTGIPAFSFGPARIEPRSAWLSRKVREGVVSLGLQVRLEEIWAGGRLRQRKRGPEAAQERDILQAIDGASYVVSVALEGFAAEAGLAAATDAAHMALTGVALLWRNSSYVMQGIRLNHDPAPRIQTVLAFVADRQMPAGWRQRGDRLGQFIQPDTWQATLRDAEHFASALGEVLTAMLSPKLRTDRSKLLLVLAQSLMWFHAGCREENEPVGLVCFGSSLDALASGGGPTAILKLLEAQAGLRPNAPINATSSQTFRGAVEEIYSEGRSRIAHGTSDRVGHDWSLVLGRAHQLARLALVNVLERVGSDPTLDNVECLLEIAAPNSPP